MNCDDVRARLPDRMDDLLDADGARAMDDHLARCAACADAAGLVRARLERLYRPYEVLPPPADLLPRLHARRHAPARRPFLVLLRYAASFAAGVLATLWLTSAGSDAKPRGPVPPAIAPPPAVSSTVSFPPRRIR